MNNYSAQAIENRNYELHSLGWKSFQDLCATIFSELMGQEFEIYAPIKDHGIDGYFQGLWHANKRTKIDGPTIVQCKFTNSFDKKLSKSLLKNEYEKARALAKDGLVKNYVLITNLSITVENKKSITQDFQRIPEIENVFIFGKEWITKEINESAELRMLVPRIYGLGDLGYILDERARRQAEEILKSMREDLTKFVITKAYNRSAKALSKKGFIILLGEPAAGKSAIAATLSLAALDKWHAMPVIVKDASSFEDRWNPNDPNQIFWIDDAFGATSYLRERTSEWNSVLKHMNAAIKRGSKIIFTSRDYIYKAAKNDLKLSEFPLFEDSSVIINLQELTKEEKRQILYNHIKLGGQSQSFKDKIKPFLEEICENKKFLPETARRLGDQSFTKDLTISADALTEFVEKPKDFLIQTIKELDSSCRAAIAIIFMNQGKLGSPLKLGKTEKEAIKKLGANESSITLALESLKDSFTKIAMFDESYYWTFRHPTISDAFSEIVASNHELMEIYLIGVKADNLLNEVVCGNAEVKGTKVIISKEMYPTIAARLNELEIIPTKYSWTSPLCSFLASRCSKSFQRYYISNRPEIIECLNEHGHSAYTGYANLACSLNKNNLLPEATRKLIANAVIEDAVTELNPAIFGSLGDILSPEEYKAALKRIKEETLPEILSNIEYLYDNYDPDYSPDSHFDNVDSFLRSLEEALEGSLGDESEARNAIDDAFQAIEDYKNTLHEEYPEREHDREGISLGSYKEEKEPLRDERSIFSDIAD